MIDEYINLRFKTCMLNSEFADKVRNPENGHLFMKVLKERVVDELGLTAEPEIEDMVFNKRMSMRKENIRYDPESMYNM